MKIIFFKKQRGKSNWKRKIIITISISCCMLMSTFMLNQPAATWQEADQWQVKVYQKADHMMADAPPWLMINEFKMDLTRQESQPPVWCLQVEDMGGNELLPGISSLLIYYSKDSKVIDGYAFNEENKKVMIIDEFFELSLYGSEFFSPQRKRYQNLLMIVKDEVKVELCEEKGKNAWWDKEHPWWINYESNNPPLKAQLQSE
jgi:hypothetical protein